MPNYFMLAAGMLLLSWVLVPAFPRSVWARKVSPWVRIAGFALLGWGYNELWGAVSMVAIWLLLPWVELATRVRGIRLPQQVTLDYLHPPSVEKFPDLRERSRDIEQEGFARIADLGWKTESQTQFLRLFLAESGESIGVLHCVEQGPIVFAFSSVVQVDDGGGKGKEMIWRSWNSPLPSGLAQAPGYHLYQVGDVDDYGELLELHEQNLAHEVAVPTWRSLERDEAIEVMQQEVRQQLLYNQDRGFLALVDGDQLRYTWRGLVYLYGQVLRQMLAI